MPGEVPEEGGGARGVGAAVHDADAARSVGADPEPRAARCPVTSCRWERRSSGVAKEEKQARPPQLWPGQRLKTIVIVRTY